MKLDEFFTKKRHYLIMTDGGKPVYSRYGDEVENNSIFATISAMITKFTIFNSTESYKEEINIISNNKNKNIFRGSWWFNNRRKHPSYVIKSNNKDYFVVRTLSHSQESDSDFELIDSPNPKIKNEPQFISSRKYVENSKDSFGRNYKRKFKFSGNDNGRF
jgi:cellulose biosynthesis protein BcsQ